MKKGIILTSIFILTFIFVGCKKQDDTINSATNFSPITQVTQRQVNKDLWAKAWDVAVFSNTGFRSGIVDTLTRGDKLKATVQKGEWYKIKGQTKSIEGWVRSEEVTNISVSGINVNIKVSAENKVKAKEYLKKAEYWENYDAKKDPKAIKWVTGGEPLDDVYEGRLLRYEAALRLINSVDNYYKAYKLDPNNEKAMLGLVQINPYKIDDSKTAGDANDIIVDEPWLDEIEAKYGSFANFQIYITKRALLLPDTDKAWWYRNLAWFYQDKNNRLSYRLFSKSILECQKSGQTNSNFFISLLYNSSFVTEDLNKKKEIFEKILTSFSNWKNIDDVKIYYERTLSKLQKRRN